MLDVCVSTSTDRTGTCGQIAENEANSHKAPAPNTRYLVQLGAGQHTVTLVSPAPYTDHTKSDAYDVYGLTILEFGS